MKFNDTIRKIIVLLLTASAWVMNSCVHESLVPQGNEGENPPPATENCDPAVVDFENEIAPLLRSNCAMSGCHDAASRKEGIVLDSYQSIMNSDVIVAFDVNDSELYKKITEDDPDDVMPPPPNQKLTADQISLIGEWIAQGAKNETCSSANCDLSSVTFNASIKPIITNKCVGCHSGTGAGGGLNFTTHAGVQAVALNGRLWGAVTHAAGFSAMPQGGKLSDCELDKIEVWISEGALNN